MTLAMASEVVCGLIFRLLLPICLTVGECGPLTEVTWEGEGDAWGEGRASEQFKKGFSAPRLGLEVRAMVPGLEASDARCPECHSMALSLPALGRTISLLTIQLQSPGDRIGMCWRLC